VTPKLVTPNSGKPVFFDERQRRWWLTRRALEVLGLVLAALVVVFFLSIAQRPALPQLLLPDTRPELHPSKDRPKAKNLPRRRGRRSRVEALGTIPANYDPLRAAFYVPWDYTSLSSLQQHYRELDLLIPEQLHAVSPDGHMVIEPDEKLKAWLDTLDVSIPIMPLVNNYDGVNWRTEEMVRYLKSPDARKRLVSELIRFVNVDAEGRRRPEAPSTANPSAPAASTPPGQSGVVVDFEEIPEKSQDDFEKFISELTIAAHVYNRKVMVCLPAADSSYDYAYFGKVADAVILMNYDEHWLTSDPGPITSQAWYQRNLESTLKEVPPEKLVMGIANYSYDWPKIPKGTKGPGAKEKSQSTSFQEALVTAKESEASVYFDEDAMNPAYEYEDEHHITHEVWLLDGVTAYNEIRAAERKQIRGTALWRLGSEDPSIWSIWDNLHPDDSTRDKIKDMPPGYDLAIEGEGDVWRITATPTHGKREFRYDSSTDLFTDENYLQSPFPYQIDQIGAIDKDIALTFDDGPDPRFTPRILDILKEKSAVATFFITGVNANASPELLQRIYREGHEIGNHTYTHPSFNDIPLSQLEWEITLTQRLFESRLGIKTLLFRPPYGIDHQPESDNDVRLLPIPQSYGYLLVGAKIDPHDWGEHGGGAPPPPKDIVKRVIDQAMGKPIPPAIVGVDGHIVLLHDGGGNRENTVEALPGIIDGLRAHGFHLTGVSELIGQTRAQTMPTLTATERWTARADGLIFDLYRWLRFGIAWIFLAGIALISGRALLVGVLAIIEKLRADPGAHPEYRPKVSVLIPAYNEELSVVGTVESALRSDYPDVEVIVVNDGSRDRTAELLDECFAANPRVRIIHQSNGGKPAALNRALSHADGEIVVTIDADTEIEPDAISKLVRNFADPTVGAVAGNTKVGNRHLWITRWQALEYISSQNMEKRAFDLLNCITVVPGAIGAWRASAMRECGGFTSETVAEDTDLTLAIRRRHWRILYDDQAIAWTQAPESPGELIRQRFRWTFGTMQAVWKHRDTLARFKYGTLGWIALPNVFLFQIVLPLFSPLIDLLFVGSLTLWGLGQLHIRQIPQLWSGDDVRRAVLFFLGFLVIDFCTCVIAFLLERDEDYTLLFPMLIQRFYYRQMMYVVLFRALVRAVQGRQVGWGHAIAPAQT